MGMKYVNALKSGVAALGVGVLVFMAFSSRAAPSSPADDKLRSPDAFASISNTGERSVALFLESAKVINSPRCLNCHPGANRPTQGDQLTPHQPLVLRGTAGHGISPMMCANCHQAENNNSAHVPGNAKWHLAPLSMAWQGKSVAQICAGIKDKTRNGGRDLTAIVDHMSNDDLVGWAWKTDAGRKPALGTQAEFGALIKAWVESGAVCPPL
jgi:hypothetical protein